MGQAQINVRIRACSRTSIARTKQAALTHNVRGKELKRIIIIKYRNNKIAEIKSINQSVNQSINVMCHTYVKITRRYLVCYVQVKNNNSLNTCHSQT